ncbi:MULTISPECIES: hypothetical protein [Bradyrhizobium]|uniref:hypothetical protein n=1 Tax=Bradyrhizobium elkanii TaxID=29448 RepID=UPI000489CEE9|nr:hypothetical protein [Bradyrhizobium elkanii]
MIEVTSVAYRDELAELEAERDRLRSMIAYHERPVVERPVFAFPQPPLWVRFVLVGIAGGIGALVVAGVLAGQISLSFVVFSVVLLALAAYILPLKFSVFGTSMRVGDLLGFVGTFPPQLATPGAPEARQRLLDCEAQITKLKERH